jgi:hypothetical protein
MNSIPKNTPHPSHVLAEAFLSAGKALGLTQKALISIVRRDRSSISRHGIDPGSAAGELALLLIRIYRSLFVLVGGDPEQMRHWMHTLNHHTGGIPAEQICAIQGLVRVVEYLDAIRGKL